jgi:hypothetical protein
MMMSVPIPMYMWHVLPAADAFTRAGRESSFRTSSG